MYLKCIRANGFKSFADKTNITLENNITCVVGPNGSGKSNIVDAVRWVLGEQSVKSLRGTNAMVDVIFAGSKSRKGATRAEVALEFCNSDHYLKSEFTEIEVKRVLYGTGESEYFINGSRVRLKDITDLFLDTGAGLDSFNIISQGSIESVVTSKPQERRVIFEEAAGVLKYKKRKEESLRKLEKTKENMEKVRLIVDELEVTIGPLKEQSENAKKYLELKEELKNIEIATITGEITTIHEDYTKLNKEIEVLNKQMMEEDTASSDDASSLETLKLKNVRLEEKISEANQKLIQVTSQFVNLQNEKMMYTERKKYAGDAKEVSNNIVSLKEEILSFDQAICVLDTEITHLKETLKEVEHNLREVNEKNSFSKLKRNSLHSKLQNNLRDLYELKSKQEILESHIANDTKMPVSVKNVLNHVRLKGIHSTIGKLLTIPDEYVAALDVAMGASVHFVVVENENSAKEAISFLKENKLGRATFFPLSVIKGRSLPGEIIKKAKGVTGFIGVASELVSYDSKYKEVMENQLGNVLVVSNIDVLNQLGKILEYKYRIVSLDGEIMHAGGSLTGGTLKNDNSVLKDKITLETTRKEILNKNNENAKLQEEMKGFESDLETLQENEEQLNRKVIQLEESIRERSTLLESKKQKQMELSKELEGSMALKEGHVDEKLLALMDEVSEAETQKNIMEETLNQLKEEKSVLASEIDELEKKYREKNSAFNRLQNELKTKEVALGKMDIRLDNLLLSLNDNYNLTYEQARLSYILEMESEVAKAKVASLKNEIHKLGEVNVFSIEEYERVSTRYEFLLHQIEDLEASSSNLLTIIEEMDTIMVEKFTKTFALISEEFKSVFKKLFKGGNGMLKLTDPDNILETGIEIIAEPPGKKLNSIGLLSGGEKTLTAISLLFAVLNVKTVPFCILDEVEAALDEANVDAFGKYLQEKKENSQFILITHKKRTMEYADTLYGITMQESGVSKIVSVKLENM